MPEDSRRVYATHLARISKSIAVPLRYAYDWCTDFRTDDGKFSRSKPRFQMLHLSEDRIVRVRRSPPKVKPLKVAVELVRLHPPDAWHVDQIDEADLETVDYKLTRLGPKKTRLTLVLVERWMVPNFPPKADWVKGTKLYWDNLVAALEDRYRQGLPAQG
ncbi:MAG TPA: hypothetical protein VGX00_01795 [Thermoplasmata archaeon]|nr:hypothetical protein [Thermoplasmata archaeon]